MSEHGARCNSQDARRSKQKVGVNVKEKARFTVTITDNLEGDVTEINTNLMCASIKKVDSYVSYVCLLSKASEIDVFMTIKTMFNAIKELCERIDYLASYKGLLEVELENLKESSDWEKSKQEGLI